MSLFSQLLPDFPEKAEDAVNKRVLSGELTALVGARVMGEQRHICSCGVIHRAGGGLKHFLRFGGRDGIRTHDLLIANEEKTTLRRGSTIT